MIYVNLCACTDLNIVRNRKSNAPKVKNMGNSKLLKKNTKIKYENTYEFRGITKLKNNYRKT